MVLADTSIWVDHLRRGDDILAGLLGPSRVLTHPFIIGELALGALRQRDAILKALTGLPHVTAAHHDEVMHLIDREQLFGLGIGYVDTHLLAAVRLTPASVLWTRDKRLATAADRLGVGARIVS